LRLQTGEPAGLGPEERLKRDLGNALDRVGQERDVGPDRLGHAVPLLEQGLNLAP
jgi:hypothetical protein